MMSDIVSSKLLSNVRYPLDIDDMSKNIDLDANPMFIKQKMDKWFEVGHFSNIYIQKYILHFVLLYYNKLII